MKKVLCLLLIIVCAVLAILNSSNFIHSITSNNFEAAYLIYVILNLVSIWLALRLYKEKKN